MSESGDYSPAPYWNNHGDFSDAKRAYRSKAAGTLKEAVNKGVVVSDKIPKKVTTDCESPLVIAIDVTGSMGEWPVTIFSKLPYLEYEGQEYLGDDMEISFCAIGDSQSDKYPLQVQPFVKGAGLKDKLEDLIHEGNGGGNSQESYDLAALYYSTNCEMEGAIRKPIFIFIGDEGIYDPDFSPNAADLCKTKVDDDQNPKSAFAALCQKFSVYIIRKRYSGGEDSIRQQWEKMIGKDRVIALQDAERVVDVIFGILAQETGRVDYFVDELKDRQGKDKDGPEKIDVVLKSLHTVHKNNSVKKIAGPKGAVGAKSKSKSVAASKSVGKKSVSLLDDDDE